MKKIATGISAVAVLVVISGVSIAELAEYGTVARNEVQNAVKGAVSTELELKRLAVIMEKVDAKAKEQKRIVAKAQIDLEDAEMFLAQSKSKCQRIKDRMAMLRKQPDTYVTSCGTNVATGVKKELAILLSSYQTHTQTLAAREKAVIAHRQAVAKLTARFNDWTLQRDTLHQQLESLQSRHAANQIAKVNDRHIADDELSRAIVLRKEIESRIRVEERVDSTTTLSTFSWANDDDSRESVEDQVDRILSQS